MGGTTTKKKRVNDDEQKKKKATHYPPNNPSDVKFDIEDVAVMGASELTHKFPWKIVYEHRSMG